MGMRQLRSGDLGSLKIGELEMGTQSWEVDQIQDLVSGLQDWSDRDARLIAEGGSIKGKRREVVGNWAHRQVRVDALIVLMMWAGLVGLTVGIWIAQGGR